MTRLFILTVVAVALVVAACGDSDGGGGSSAAGERTVEVEMVDIAFKPTTLDVERGETVRFVFRNTGKVAHDAFIGDAAAQRDHEQDMRAAGSADGGGHGDHGDEAKHAVTVEPGASEELTHTFDEAGTVEIGCHQPGHYDAGMKVTVQVA